MSATSALAIAMLIWLTIGVVTGIIMGRAGHDRFGWTLLGAVLGPLVVAPALVFRRRGTARPVLEALSDRRWRAQVPRTRPRSADSDLAHH